MGVSHRLVPRSIQLTTYWSGDCGEDPASREDGKGAKRGTYIFQVRTQEAAMLPFPLCAPLSSVKRYVPLCLLSPFVSSRSRYAPIPTMCPFVSLCAPLSSIKRYVPFCLFIPIPTMWSEKGDRSEKGDIPIVFGTGFARYTLPG
jgi:hypothetical protein